jgi:hypothetical protein
MYMCRNYLREEFVSSIMKVIQFYTLPWIGNLLHLEETACIHKALVCN